MASRRDYERTAELFRTQVDTAAIGFDDNATGALRRLAEGFATEYKTDNPRFDRVRFLKACGFEMI